MVRRPIAVIVSRFPLITETFILREIIELERQGQPVLLVPLIRETPEVVHEEARPWIERAMYTPYVSLGAMVRKPLVMLRLLFWICSGAILHPVVLFKSLILFPKAVSLAERLQQEGIRHIHAHYATYPALVATIIAALTDITFSFTAHAHDIFVNRALLREKVRQAKFIRAISQFNKQFLESLYPEARDKIEVVHVGVVRPPLPAERGEGQGEGRLLCIAALKPYKGIPILLDALRLLDRDLTCDIIGIGPQKIATKDPRVRMRGALPQHVVAEEIAKADVFVLPSIVAPDGQMEGIPVALMEAMAAKKAVVASALSGIPELVEHEVNGLLVDPANPRQLADAIARLLDDPALRERLGARAAEKVASEFDLTTTVRELLMILDQHNVIHRGPDSVVTEIVENGDALIVKKHLSREGESRPPVIRAADEARILTKLTGYAVPRVIWQAGDTVVMSHAPGVPLTRILRDGSMPQAARAAGTWLAAFQQFERGDGRDATTLLAERALADARRVGASKTLRARVERLHRALLGGERVAVSHHGDFWPGNVYFSLSPSAGRGGSVQVIDFEGYGLSLPAHDIAYFFLHAALYFPRMNVLRESFLEGYGQPIDAQELALCRIATALQLTAKSDRGLTLAQRIARNRVLHKELA